MAKDTSQKLKMTRILDMLRIDSTRKNHSQQMFYGWLVSLGGKMKIVSPEALDQRYKE